MVKEIAMTTGKQTRDSGSIVNAVERINKVVQQNVEVISSLGSAAEKLLDQAGVLAAEIEKFKV